MGTASKILIISSAMVLLASCGGGLPDRFYFGGNAYGKTSGIADNDGKLAGVPLSNTQVYTNNLGGYSVGTDWVGAARYGSYGASGSDQAFLAIAAIHPNSYMGSRVRSGTITYIGEYNLNVVDYSNGFSNPDISQANGAIVFTADLEAGNYYADTSAVTGEELIIHDGYLHHDGISSSYGGASGSGTYLMGEDGIVGVFSGDSDTDETFYAGGFLGTPN